MVLLWYDRNGLASLPQYDTIIYIIIKMNTSLVSIALARKRRRGGWGGGPDPAYPTPCALNLRFLNSRDLEETNPGGMSYY